jgi:subtilisin family serine protease
LIRLSAAAVVGATMTPLLGMASAQAGTHRVGLAHSHKFSASQAAPQMDAALAHLHGATSVDVMIQLSGQPSADAWAHPASGGTSTAARTDANQAQAATDEAAQQKVTSAFGAPATRATVLYRTHVLYNGIAVHTTAGRLHALSRLPGVKAIHKLIDKHLDNSVTVPLIGAPAVWNTGNDGNNGATGKHVRIGIIDTGIDYTHADFGGEGTTAAYTTAKANDTAPPAIINGGFDGSKVVGGHDFVGDAYDASTPAKDVPLPDPNPLDCNSHGTHVAGSAAGLGVLKNGTTYTGTYDASLDESLFHVGPGVAPGAELYGLKIFGCSGSTNVVAEALDWAADPNGDGDLSDHLDVVNMSLGSDYASSEDPDAVASDNASLVGITVVAAAGNGGDLFDVGGSPGNAVRAIGVAASDDSQDVVDELQVDAPVAIAGNYPGEQSVNFDWANAAPVSGDLQTTGDLTQPPSATNDTDGCDTLPADSLAGKIAYFFWTDTGANRRCGSTTRTNHAEAAGAIGAVFFDDQNEFSAGISGNAGIPAMLVTKDAGTAINAQLALPATVSVTLTNALHNQGLLEHPQTTDTVAGFSSRGIGEAGNVKPDVTAPGVTVFSAGMGTGTDGLTDSGTSMATPHVTGVAALVKAAHPSWTPEQIKASIMNTAGQDVCDTARTLNNGAPVETACPGANLSPERVGAGRVEADKATANQTLAMVNDNSGAVSVSFGTLDATAPTTYTRTITVKNYRPVQTVQYVVSYDAIDANPGATYSVSPSEISLAPGQSQVVTVTLSVDPSQLVSRPEQSLVDDGQASAAAHSGTQPSFVPDASGRVLLTPASPTADEVHLPQLRVPVYAAPRPASTMTQASSVALNSTGAGALTLSGNGVDVPGVNADDKHRRSVADVFELQGTSAAMPSCSATQISGCVPFGDDKAGDLKDVGFSSDVPSYLQFGEPDVATSVADGAQGYFGIATQGPWRTPSNYEEYDVVMTDEAGNPLAVTFNTRLTGLDQFVAETLILNPDGSPKLNGQGQPIADVEPINNSFDGVDDTNVFNSDVLTMPVWLGFLADNGVINPSAPGGTRVNYLVDSFTESSGFTDSIGDPTVGQTPMSVDLAQPALWAGNLDDAGFDCGALGYCTTLLDDEPGVQLAVQKNAAQLAADAPQGLLVFHHDNANGNRAQVVSVLDGTRTTLTVAHNPAVYGQANSATVSVAALAAGAGVPAGTVKVLDGTTVIAHGTLSSGHVTLALPTRTVGLHHLVAQYAGGGTFAASNSSGLTLTVKKATSKTTLTSSATKVKAGTAVTLKSLTSVVSPGKSAVTGTVTFFDGTKKLGSFSYTGSRSFVTPKLAKGTHVLKAVYSGSATLLGSTGTVTVAAS